MIFVSHLTPRRLCATNAQKLKKKTSSLALFDILKKTLLKIWNRFITLSRLQDSRVSHMSLTDAVTRAQGSRMARKCRLPKETLKSSKKFDGFLLLLLMYCGWLFLSLAQLIAIAKANLAFSVSIIYFIVLLVKRAVF